MRSLISIFTHTTAMSLARRGTNSKHYGVNDPYSDASSPVTMHEASNMRAAQKQSDRH
ncbi:MAG TPA: hypothetical protein VFC10_11520 [Terriglobia bacterium]|nr:hypothetical protein [Terriglobia bacterium]